MTMSRKLTVAEAEKFARKVFSRYKNKEDKEFYVAHSRAVAETASILASRKKVDKDVLIMAGWLHDIGSIVDRKNHAEHSIELLEKEDYILSEKLKDCILNHGRSKHPTTVEGKIFRIADKASVFRPELLQSVVDTKGNVVKDEDLDFLEMCASRATSLLKGYRLK